MKVGVLTSGGDSPGMNTAISEIVKIGESYHHEMIGIYRGYNGLFNKEYKKLQYQNIRHVYKLGGSILFAGRNEAMKTSEGMERAVNEIKKLGLDALIVIGGNGSITGASLLSLQGINVMAFPASIDNDIWCSDYSIGYDTCLNVVVESLDRIRDTAISHDRVHVVEVMGRNCGLIGLNSGYSSNAECILIPEEKLSISEVCEQIELNKMKGYLDQLVIVAEGYGSAIEISKQITSLTGIKTTSTVLGQIQRGGSPTVFDRAMARKFGFLAMEEIVRNHFNKLLVAKQTEVFSIPISYFKNKPKEINLNLLKHKG
ncbi:ATP-dependent 6-phosphofructokinase [Bacillus songklensis]|uniref:6-phosphofructokinase n=1 Tax=Bacillus songklensis TaxID=1069116 RepID=A0ABV8B8Z2_9BACI